MNPRPAMAALCIENTLAVLLGIALLFFRLKGVAEDFPGGYAAFLALGSIAVVLFQPFWSVYRVGGQFTPTVFLLFALVLLWHTAGRLTLSAVAMVLIVVLKPAFSLALLWLACTARLRYLLRVAAAGADFTLVSILILGFPIHAEFLQQVLHWGGTLQPWPFNSSITVTFDNLLLQSRFAGSEGLLLARTGGRVAAGAILVWLARRSLTQSRPAASRHFQVLMAVTFAVAVCPVVWEHYLSVLFIPLTYMVAVRHQLPRTAVLLMGAIFLWAANQNVSFAMFLNNTLASDNWMILVLAGIFKGMMLGLTVLWLVRYHPDLFATYQTAVWHDSEQHA